MDIFVGSDESGTFSQKEAFFVFGGVIALGKGEKEVLCRKFSYVEKVVRDNLGIQAGQEIKASLVGGKWKNKIYRSLNNVYQFAVAIRIEDVHPFVFASKRSKQRYMDFAYKVGLRSAFSCLIDQGIIVPEKIRNVIVEADEHSTATNGLYELSEGLLSELKLGTFNPTYEKYFPPLFPSLNDVKVEFCDSKTKTLVRMADFVANHVYNGIRFESIYREKSRKLCLKFLPKNWSKMGAWQEGKESSIPDSSKGSLTVDSTTKAPPKTEWRHLRKPSQPGLLSNSISTSPKTENCSSSTIPSSNGFVAKRE